MSKNSNKRNVKIEVLRIIACFLVIFSHIRDLPWKPSGELRESAVFFDTAFSICVTIFFMITGFFIYNKKGTIIKDWLSLIKKFFTELFIPMMLTWIFCIVFDEFLVNTKTFIECIESFDIKVVWDNIYAVLSTYKTGELVGTAGHLWFFFSYFIIIIEYPIVRLILTKTNKYVLLILFFAFSAILIYNDYIAYFSEAFNVSPFYIFQKPVFYSAVGHILYNDFIKKYIDGKYDYNENSIIINKPIFILSFIIYSIVFFLLYKTQKGLYLGRNNGYPYTSWSSYYSFVLTVTFILMFYDLNLNKLLNEKITNLIYFISSKTFGIYLIHYPIATRLKFVLFQDYFADRRSIFIHHIIYYTLYGLFIFIISLLFTICLDKLRDIIKSIFNGRILCQKEKDI